MPLLSQFPFWDDCLSCFILESIYRFCCTIHCCGFLTYGSIAKIRYWCPAALRFRHIGIYMHPPPHRLTVITAHNPLIYYAI